ncbi:hypothetical protein MJO29_003588, partial [Puccinia striiformis f. sp. tritici]
LLEHRPHLTPRFFSFQLVYHLENPFSLSSICSPSSSNLFFFPSVFFLSPSYTLSSSPAMNNRPPPNNLPDDHQPIRQRRTVSAAGQFNLDPIPPAIFPVRPANTAARFNPDINPPVRQIPINVRHAVPPHIDPPVHPAPRDDRHRLDADIDRNVITIINSTTAQIRDRDRLLPDGSNYPAWQDFVCERVRDAINRPNFFDTENENPTFERIARAILINSLHESMRRHISRLATAQAMFIDLRARFHTISRAAQMNAFNNLLDFNATNFNTTAEMAAHIEDALDEMEDVRVEFTRDHLAGLILQRGLASVPEVNMELNRRIEFRMEWTDGEAMDFDTMIRNVDIIRRQHFLANRSVQNPPAPALAMNAEIDRQPSPSQPADTFAGFHPDNIPDAGDFMAMQAGLCWQCRSPDHLLRHCPLRQRPNQNRTAYRPPTNQFRQPPYNGNLGGGFQSHYPIITPPGFTGVYPQPTPVNRFNGSGTQPTPPAPLRREIFVTPLNIDEPAIVNTNSLNRNEKIILYWHRFFGHASLQKIRQIIQEKLIFDLPVSIPKGEIKCDICARGKSLNKNRLSSSDRPIDKLQIITADIVGPFEEPTFNKGLYLLTIRDIATGFSEAKVMATKDLACKLLIQTVVRWERQTSKLSQPPQQPGRRQTPEKVTF